MEAPTSSQQQPSFDLRDGLNNIGSDFGQVSSHGGRGRDYHERAPRDGDSDGRGPHYGGRGRDPHHERGHHDGARGRDRHGEGHPSSAPPPILNQLLSLFYILLLQGPVVLETAIATLSESNPVLYREITGFLEVNGRSLFDAFRKVGLVQNQDGSWSATSVLPQFELFFNGVADAFSQSVFQFLDAKKHQHMDRTAFITASNQVITACGVLFLNPDGKILMQVVPDKTTGQPSLDDFGGKVEHPDQNIINAFLRELAEETNGLFPQYFDLLGNLLGHIYLPRCKYLLLICRAPAEFEGIDLSLFGSSEEHSSIKRTVQWVSGRKFLDAKNLHPRLSISPEVKAKISELCPP